MPGARWAVGAESGAGGANFAHVNRLSAPLRFPAGRGKIGEPPTGERTPRSRTTAG